MHPRPTPSLLGSLLLLCAALPTALAHDPPKTPSTTKTNFQFSSCVSNCVASSGCTDTSSSTCVCRPPLLSDVTTCLFYFCPSSLRAFTTQLLDKAETGCSAAGRAIPSKELDKLEKEAAGLVSKLPKTTSALTKTTSSAVRTTTTKAAETTPPPPPVVPVPAPEPEPSTPATTFVQSATSTTAAPRRDPTDSSPFATVKKAEAAPGRGWRGTGWVVVPFVAGAMVL